MRKKTRREANLYDCVVVGGGPGGLVSALYLSRFRRKVVLIDSGHSRAQWIPRIRNLIGYVNGLSGKDLLMKLERQVRKYQAEWVHGEAQVFHDGKGFKVLVNGETFKTRNVILATGMRDHQPELDNIPSLRKKAVLAYCPICDGFDHSDKRIGVFIRNRHGLAKLEFLSQFSSHMIGFQVKPFALSKKDQAWIRKKGFELHAGEIESLRYRRRPRGVYVQMKDQPKPIAVDVAYVALGVDFSEKTIQHLRRLKRTKDGFIVTKSHQETSIPGLYAVGDCVSALAQISVAIGQAALAATRIHNHLNSKSHKSSHF